MKLCMDVCRNVKKFRYGSNDYNRYVLGYGESIMNLIRTIFTIQRYYKSTPEKIVFGLDNIAVVIESEPRLLEQLTQSKLIPKN